MKSRADWLVLIICLFISLVYWWSLHHDTHRLYDVSFKFDFVIPDTLQVSEDSPHGFNIKIRCSDAVYNSVIEKIPEPTISIKLNGEAFDTIPWDLVEKEVKLVLQSFEIDELVFEEKRDFSFKLGSTLSKKVELLLDSELEYYPGYEPVMKPKLIPDSVILYGASSWLDTIDQWYTEKLVVTNIKGEKQYRLKVKSPPNKKSGLSLDFVEVTIAAEPFTEKQLRLPVQLISSKSSFSNQFKPLPSSANVFVKVAVKDYSLLSNEQIQIGIFLDSLVDTKSPVEIQLIDLPNYVKEVKIYPKHVELLRYQ